MLLRMSLVGEMAGMTGIVIMPGMLGAARTYARLEAARTPSSQLDLG